MSSQHLWQLVLVKDPINKSANYLLFGKTCQIQIFPIDLVHSGSCFFKASIMFNISTANHWRTNAVCESFTDHEISSIGKNSRMQSCDVTLKIPEAISGSKSGGY